MSTAACAAKGGTCPAVLPLRWGRAEAEAFLKELGGGGFDVVLGTDLMYVHEAVVPLVDTLDVRRFPILFFSRSITPAVFKTIPSALPLSTSARQA